MDRSPLINEALEQQLRTVLGQLSSPVCFVCISDGSEKCGEMLLFLNHLAALCPLLSVKTLAPGEDAAADALLDADLLPATGLWNGNGFGRMVFHGVSGGHELTSFVSAVLACAGSAKPLDGPTLRDISKISADAVVQVCVSLACTHCAKLVMAAHRVAAENEHICAHMIDANLYPELVSRYRIERVPVLTVNGVPAAVGAMTLSELCTLLRKRR